MAKEQLFFRDEDSTTCHSLGHHLVEAAAEGLTEVRLHEAVPDDSKDHFWCRAFGEVLITEDADCGRGCSMYDPMNKISGKCSHKAKCHTWGEKRTFITSLAKP